jgi:hypothetical protein
LEKILHIVKVFMRFFSRAQLQHCFCCFLVGDVFFCLCCLLKRLKLFGCFLIEVGWAQRGIAAMLLKWRNAGRQRNEKCNGTTSTNLEQSWQGDWHQTG